MVREKTKFVGVYQRESTASRHGGRPDVCYDITYKDHGKQVWEKVGWRSEGYTAALASQLRAERVRDLRHGNVPAVRRRGGITLGMAWDEYLAKHIRTKAKPTNVDECRFERHIRAPLGRIPLDAISTMRLEELRKGLVSSGLSQQSVHHCLALIRRVINKAIKWKLWSGVNPVRELDLPKIDNARWRWLTPEEARKLLGDIARRSYQWHNIALLSLHTGMRASEIFELRGDHVNLHDGLIRARDTKNGRSRTVYLTTTARSMLKSRELRPGQLVFASKFGQQIEEVSDSVTRAITAVGLNAGQTDRRAKVVFHTLRHTYGSWLAMAGVPLYVIAELMGHDDMETTRRYAHLSPQQLGSSVGQVERMFASAGQQSSPRVSPESFEAIFAGTG